ncbi:UDP-glycosyltransferase 708C2-like [Silene latifolia]|uniref:UDP-glycosyltransferase 708C2-like n=1 Tax=Silene latifolia TaxID=37657 RepID=UPI003D78866F
MGKLSNTIEDNLVPHIAVCPSAGMAHLLPFLRVSSMLSSFNCKVTLMTIRPTLSTAETHQVSSFLAENPHITALDTQLPCLENPMPDHNVVNASTTTHPTASPDPFFLRYVAISNSAHLLARHLIDLSPPPTAILCDIMFVSGFHLALGHLGIPIYVLPITSSRFFAFATFFSHLDTPINNVDDTELVIASSMAPVTKSSIPPPFFNPNHIFTKLIVSNSSWLHKCKGIVSYSFDYLEKETLSALRKGDALSYLPPIFTIGPLKPLYDTKTTMGSDGCDNPTYLAWLDDHPSKSVLYVNFGSRTAMTKEQIRELGDGLDMSGMTFLWVIKTTVVDNQEKEKLKDLLGEDFLEKITKLGKGLVLKQWVEQDRILVHPAVGGFMTHCGWNSITETAKCGLPVLGWPLHGDQRVNAEVVETAGLGVWARGWGWIRERLVNKEEISNKIKEVMMNKELRESAKRVGEEASKAWEDDNGTSRLMMSKLIQHMSSKNVLTEF